MASETLASVILPRPASDLKTESNFSVKDSNTALFQIYAVLQRHFKAKKPFWRTWNCKGSKAILQGQKMKQRNR
jgi:hypothetical protein